MIYLKVYRVYHNFTFSALKYNFFLYTYANNNNIFNRNSITYLILFKDL